MNPSYAACDVSRSFVHYIAFTFYSVLPNFLSNPVKQLTAIPLRTSTSGKCNEYSRRHSMHWLKGSNSLHKCGGNLQ